MDLDTRQFAEDLQKAILRKIEELKVYSSFKDNIWGVDLADMLLISTFNKEFRFLLCINNIYSKYAWVAPFKDKKHITITNAVQKKFH